MPVRLEPDFLDGFQYGRRFALWISPPAGKPQRGSILCVQPFGEEANLSRRVLVAQASRLARSGWTTLLMDPFGTGDSDGGSHDASLPIWRADLLHASRLARERSDGSFVLWGTRLGALLAAELALALDQLVSAMVFWQPASNGGPLLDPLLKLAKVGAVARTAPSDEGSVQTHAGSQVLPATITLAGSALQRSLVDDLGAMAMQPPIVGERGVPCPVLMLGMQRVVTGSAPKALSTLAGRWLDEGYLTQLRVVQAEPFWASLEPSMPVAAFEETESFLEVCSERA